MKNKKCIPALRFHWLTNIYDWLIKTFMPEKEFKSAIINNSNVQNGYQVLDFGIGTATLSIMAYHRNPNASYLGIDVDDKIIAIANQKIKSNDVLIEIMKYEGGKLPFMDNSFDRVISSLVIHHLSTEQKLLAFAEFKRILKPKGEVHIADWGKPSNILMRLLFHIVQLLDGYETTGDNVAGKLPFLINQAGFKEVSVVQKYNTILGTVEIFKIR